MKQRRKSLSVYFSTLFFALLTQGCHTFYVPQHIVTPMHEKKGDIELNLQGLYALSFSANYAITDQIMAGISGFNFSEKDSNSVEHLGMKGVTLDFGYYKVNKEKNRRIEMMAGTGLGHVNNYSTFPYLRYYFQPSIGFIDKNMVSILSIRINGMSYSSELSSVPPFKINFFEPCYTLRAGGEMLKFHGQFGFSIPFMGDAPSNFGFVPFTASLGISFKLNALKQKGEEIKPLN